MSGLYSNVSTFQRQATFQSGPKMWKHVYIEMFPHLKYGTFQPRKNVETCLIAMFPHFENTLLFTDFFDGGSNHGMNIILHNKVGPS